VDVPPDDFKKSLLKEVALRPKGCSLRAAKLYPLM